MNEKPNLARIVRYIVPKNVRTFDTFLQNESALKSQVKEFWNEKSCGEIYVAGQSEKEYYELESKSRYRLEPYIHDFAKFQEGRNKDVLEIGVGMGTDHAEWAKSNPKSMVGVDLTLRAIEHTKKRFVLLGLTSGMAEADAEQLPFNDNSFDLVYSWGVLHHSPNTSQAIREILRVLRPGGVTRIMIYHKYSLTGYLLWIRYGLLTAHPFKSLNDIYFNYLESPGTKAFSVQETRHMFSQFSKVDTKVQLSFGDLLAGAVGQRHGGVLLSVAKRLWPRKLLSVLFKNHGLLLLIEAQK